MYKDNKVLDFYRLHLSEAALNTSRSETDIGKITGFNPMNLEAKPGTRYQDLR